MVHILHGLDLGDKKDENGCKQERGNQADNGVLGNDMYHVFSLSMRNMGSVVQQLVWLLFFFIRHSGKSRNDGIGAYFPTRGRYPFFFLLSDL
jgi:hypothetical protein